MLLRGAQACWGTLSPRLLSGALPSSCLPKAAKAASHMHSLCRWPSHLTVDSLEASEASGLALRALQPW